MVKPRRAAADITGTVASALQQPARSSAKIIKGLMLVIVFFGTMAVYRQLTQPPPYHPKYHTVAHRFLDLEARYTTVPDESYELLDNVIDSVKAAVHYDPSIKDPQQRQDQLLAVFNTIDVILIDHNFIFPPGEWTSTLGEALADHDLSSSEMQAALEQPHNARRVDQIRNHADQSFHFMSCAPAAFMYMGIAEELGIPLKPVLLPKHVFVRAAIDKNHWINWDPNRGRSITDAEYISGWGVEDWQVREGTFMRPLTDSEIEGEMYLNIGCFLSGHAQFRSEDPVIDCFRRAVALEPRGDYGLANLSNELLFRPDPDPQTRIEALALSQAAVGLQPNEAVLHLALAYAWAADGQTAAAVNEMNRASEIEPDNASVKYYLPAIQAGETFYGAMKSAAPIRFWIVYERGWVVILVTIGTALLGGLVWGLIVRIRRQPRPIGPRGVFLATP